MKMKEICERQSLYWTNECQNYSTGHNFRNFIFSTNTKTSLFIRKRQNNRILSFLTLVKMQLHNEL